MRISVLFTLVRWCCCCNAIFAFIEVFFSFYFFLGHWKQIYVFSGMNRVIISLSFFTFSHFIIIVVVVVVITSFFARIYKIFVGTLTGTIHSAYWCFFIWAIYCESRKREREKSSIRSLLLSLIVLFFCMYFSSITISLCLMPECTFIKLLFIMPLIIIMSWFLFFNNVLIDR